MSSIIDVQRFYDDIVTRGRRNVPSYKEVQREAAAVARQVDNVALFRI